MGKGIKKKKNTGYRKKGQKREIEEKEQGQDTNTK